MTESERKRIIALVQREVIPATECTEPIIVALYIAKATETLGTKPEKVKILLSTNILKNAMGVRIPGTGVIGSSIAVTLGTLIGKSDYQPEVLEDGSPEAVEGKKKLIDEKHICISLKENITEGLYIKVIYEVGEEQATAIISGEHAASVYVAKGDEILLNKQQIYGEEEEEGGLGLTLRKVYDFVLTAPLDEIRFTLETVGLNKKATEQSFQGDYGHVLGKMLRGTHEHEIMGDNVFSHILPYTPAACDAHMAGAIAPAMSNSGSGNQGISAALPVVVYAEENGKPEKELIRALIMSHSAVVHIKRSLGRLSTFCGCVVAAAGSSYEITWLMGGSYEQVAFAVQNMIADLAEVIYDDMEPNCTLKVTTGVSTAVLSTVMTTENRCVTSIEGIIDEGVSRGIRNLTRIGSQGMNEADEVVLDIMTYKGCQC